MEHADRSIEAMGEHSPLGARGADHILRRSMAKPARIYRIYRAIRDNAAELQDFIQAMGQKSGTVSILCAGDPLKPLKRWGEEMGELCGVLDGTHDDSYLMEAQQTFYWASLYGALKGADWDGIGFEQARIDASAIDGTESLRAAVDRLVAMGTEAPPAKLFLCWQAGDRIYRRSTPPDKQWSVEQILESDYQEMCKKTYLEPLLRMVRD